MGQFDGRPAVLRFGDYLKIGLFFKQSAKTRSKDFVIIGEQNLYWFVAGAIIFVLVFLFGHKLCEYSKFDLCPAIQHSHYRVRKG